MTGADDWRWWKRSVHKLNCKVWQCGRQQKAVHNTNYVGKRPNFRLSRIVDGQLTVVLESRPFPILKNPPRVLNESRSKFELNTKPYILFFIFNLNYLAIKLFFGCSYFFFAQVFHLFCCTSFFFIFGLYRLQFSDWIILWMTCWWGGL